MKKRSSNDFKNMLKQSIISIDQKDKNNEDNDYQLNEMILNEDMFPLKEKVLRKTELSKSSASIKQFNININNNENIKSLKAKIAKPKKERKVYTTIYIKSSINDKMQALAEQFNISKGELLENIFIEFTK